MSIPHAGGDERTARLLLDTRFQVRATRHLLPALYRAVLAIVALVGVSAVVAAALQALWLGLLALVVVPPLALVLAAAVRIGCELVLAVVELDEYVEDIADRFTRIENAIDELARDMPKLSFLRRGASTRDRAAAAGATSAVASETEETV